MTRLGTNLKSNSIGSQDFLREGLYLFHSTIKLHSLASYTEMVRADLLVLQKAL